MAETNREQERVDGVLVEQTYEEIAQEKRRDDV